MNNNKNQALENNTLDETKVIEYLLQHPDFFIHHKHLIEQMRIPHPVRGAVSLVEWQLERQRHRINQLSKENACFVEQATTNEVLFNQLLVLQRYLFGAVDLEDLLQRLRSWTSSMGLLEVDIRLVNDKWRLDPASDYVHWVITRQDFELLRIQLLGQKNHYLGKLNENEQKLSRLLPQTKPVGSVALSLMGEQGELGMMIFSSRDNQHYQAGMGITLLEQLSALLPGMLGRWIERQ